MPQQDPQPWGVGQLPTDGATKYTFMTMEALVGHFSQWLPLERIYQIIENEKQVFFVRKEVSLEETRLQFLKKCEGTLTRALSEPDPRAAGGWAPA